jgi:predicted amidohydrolase YtcJ
MLTILAPFLRGVWWACLAILVTGWGLRAQTADWILENAQIYTGDPQQTTANAIAIRGGRIMFVGSKYTGPGTHRTNLNGATVIPGLIDSHGHMAGLGELLETLNLRGVRSVAEIAAKVEATAAGLREGEWIRGRAWDQTEWGGQFPTTESLDRAAPKHPVFLSRVDGHAAWVNSRALAIAGITKATPDPTGGRILRDASGEATGILIDKAQSLVASKIPARTPEQIERSLSLAAEECVRLGLTGVHDAGVGAGELQAYRGLIQKGKLPIRVYAMIGGAGPLWESYLKKGPETGDRLTVRSIKLMSDGAMGSRGAAFWQPYSDDPKNTGLLMLTKERIAEIARQAVVHGFQVNTHAIGDRANRTVLDGYAEVLKGKNDKRFRIEHAQIVTPHDVPLFAANSVIASIQSTHATSDMRWAESRLGPDRMNGAWLAKTFLNAGVAIANGSDFPVEEADPLRGFYAAVTRQDPAGNPPGGFLPKEKLTRVEALRSWTLGGAYAAFEEKDKGTLEPGKLADFVVLSKDIMTIPADEILKTKVLMTVVGGQTVYQAK